MGELREHDFFHNVSGERARELLFLYGQKGEFMVRPSESNPYDHTISIHRGSRVTHVKLSGRGGIHRLPTGDEFINMVELVQYLMDNQNVLCEQNGLSIDITHPVRVPNSENVVNIGQDRFFHLGINGVEAEELLEFEPSGTFLIRESTSIPGEYALSVKNGDTTLHVRLYHDNLDGKFRVVPKDNFRTMNNLVEYYIKTPMIQYSGNAVRLKQPLFSTKFTAASVDDRIDALLKTAKKSNLRDGIAEEFDKIHHDKGSSMFISCQDGRSPENIRKNRYRNVVPYDHTRIKLRQLQDEEEENFSDYINANLVTVLNDTPAYAEFIGINKRYISAQGCLQHTIGDFWHMVWQENARIIVMTTREMERGRIKCSKYWPDLGEEIRYGLNHEFRVKTTRQEDHEEFVIRQFELAFIKKGETIPTAVRHIHHFQFLTWEDNGCPSTEVLTYLDEINRCLQKRCPPDCGPIVVHCSAGIGRTGTFIVLDILIDKIKMIGPQCPIDVPKTVQMVREQRATMVQTEAQYRFIYYAISTYMKLWRQEKFPASDPPRVLVPPPQVHSNEADPDDELDEVSSQSSSDTGES